MPTIVGLDLGAHSFRAVEIEKSKKGIQIIRAGSYENPKLSLDTSSDNALSSYAAAIKEFFLDSEFGTARVVMALEEKDVFMRVIEVPQMSDRELKTSINFEAEQYIPLPLSEVNLTHQKIDLPGADKDKMSVQLVAAKKTVLDKYVSLVKMAKLVPMAMEPEAMAVARCLTNVKNYSLATVILHLGLSKSLIVITYRGYVVFTRTLSIGGETLTRALEQSLELDNAQAEEYKKAYGLSRSQADGRVYGVLEPVVRKVLTELKRAEVFFTTRHAGVNINRVILSGGTALMPGLLLYMANNLDVEVELANPFKGVSFSKMLENRKNVILETGPLYTTAVGLALKEI